MGLIKAALGSLVGTIQETWKDYFVCDSLSDNVLMIKGVKNGGSGSGEIITDGSGIVVNEGQCALIIEEGKILEVAAEPGKYTFYSSESPSVFDGGFEGIKNTFKEMLGRFTYEGEVNKSQRVYYVNTKEIMGNMFGTPAPIPFRIIDKNINLDVEMPVRCNGEYTFKIVNPLVFYQNIAGNKADYYTKEDLVAQMKAEMLTALQPAFAKIAAAGVRYSEVPAHVGELTAALKDELDNKWIANRGIAFESISVNSVTMDPENEKKLVDIQMAAVNKDPNMLNATLATAAADAMRDAANNPNGAMNGFVGMNMAQNAMNAFAATSNNNTAGAAAYCPKCGKAVGADDMYCSGCGNKLK